MFAKAANSLSRLKNNFAKKYFYVLSFGALLNVSSYVGILTLQSSIHFDKNIGTKSVSVLYLTAAILSVVLTPVLLLNIGPKWSLIIGEIGFLFYTLSNLSSSFGPLVVGSLFGSLGEALIWPAAPVYISFLLREFRRDRDRSSDALEKKRNVWLGTFYGILQNSLIWGNFLSYIALYGSKKLNSVTNTDKPFNDTSECGSNFEMKDQGTDDLYKYVPENQSSIYIMVGMFAILQIISIFMHFFLIPSIGKNYSDGIRQNHWTVVCATIRSILSHVNTLEHVLLIALNFYFGLFLSYTRGVFSQAFVSCTLGVEMVGLVMMAYGCTNALASLVAGQIAFRYGVPILVAFGGVYDFLSYLLQLLWRPTLENRYSVFAIGALAGVSEGTWQFVTITIAALYFEDRQEVAFGAVNFWAELGVFTGFLLTPLLMVKTRIYLMIVVLVVGCGGYAIVERIRLKLIGYSNNRENNFSLTKNQFLPGNQFFV